MCIRFSEIDLLRGWFTLDAFWQSSIRWSRRTAAVKSHERIREALRHSMHDLEDIIKRLPFPGHPIYQEVGLPLSCFGQTTVITPEVSELGRIALLSDSHARSLTTSNLPNVTQPRERSVKSVIVDAKGRLSLAYQATRRDKGSARDESAF